MMNIDLFVGTYSPTRDIEIQTLSFLDSLRTSCDLKGVNVVVVERTQRRVSANVRSAVRLAGFQLRSCELPPAESSMEDTSRFTDWMVRTGRCPWFIVSHFDVVFNGDYIQYVRDNADYDMIGNHHDGIVAVKREAYDRCQVGFCGVGNLHLVHADYDVRIIPADHPESPTARPILSLDVGELLALRMCTLGMKHLLVCLDSGDRYMFGEGKSNLFTHSRCGSGHDKPEEINGQVLCEACTDC